MNSIKIYELDENDKKSGKVLIDGNDILVSLKLFNTFSLISSGKIMISINNLFYIRSE